MNRGAWVEYELPSDAPVEAVIYGVRGERVRTLASERQVAGRWRLYYGTADSRLAVASAPVR